MKKMWLLRGKEAAGAGGAVSEEEGGVKEWSKGWLRRVKEAARAGGGA